MGRHALIVDDEEHTLLALSLVLKKVGWKVTTFSDGESALDRVLELNASPNPFDLIVIDIEMPDMNGVEFIEIIERLGLSIPIVVISGYDARGLLAKRLRYGRIWFMEKPFEPDDFVSKIESVIEQVDDFPKRKTMSRTIQE